jgi:hypothetical protein
MGVDIERHGASDFLDRRARGLERDRHQPPAVKPSTR